MKFSQLAVLSAATLVAAHPRAHNHIAHHHLARHNGSPVEGRNAAVVTETAPGPVQTVYELNGVDVPNKDVEEGLRNGRYVVVGGEAPVATPTPTPTPSPSPSSSTSSSAKSVAIFVEKKPTTSATPTPTPEPTTSSTVAISIASSSSALAAVPTYDSSNGSGDVDLKYPEDGIPCSEFPSKYGAVHNDYLGLGGFIGIQRVPTYEMGISKSISDIETGIFGEECTTNSFCSYQCPPGYQKSQFPKIQGTTGQSIGGLFCNAEGKLVLSDPKKQYLCVKGEGGVSVKNELGDKACICRTDYPGTESETVALETYPGQSYPLTSPDALSYYWAATGGHTSAQYYINDAGAAPKDACTWNKPGSNLGNYSPLNAGVGKGTDGITYVALFYNRPSNPDGVLNFNVRIDGGSMTCKYEGGKFYADGVLSDAGCTVGFPAGKEATLVFYS